MPHVFPEVVVASMIPSMLTLCPGRNARLLIQLSFPTQGGYIVTDALLNSFLVLMSCVSGVEGHICFDTLWLARIWYS